MPVPRPYMPDGTESSRSYSEKLSRCWRHSKNRYHYEWATYLEKARKGEADAFMLGWTGDNGDADNFLYALLR